MGRNKVIPWWQPSFGDEEYRLVGEVIQSNYVNEGEYTEAFEKKIAALLNVKYAVAATSGTAAIFLALKALGIGFGDEVIVPDVTFIATANAVAMTGAQPVLADVQAKNLNISPGCMDKLVTGRTKAVIPVHVSGRAASMESIMDIAKRRGIHVIEDAAEAFMSFHKGRFLGTLGKAGCLSFSPNKLITTGQGGMVVTGDRNFYMRLKKLKDHGRLTRGTGGDDRHDSVGYNFKLTNLQAAVGLGQLHYLDSRVARARDINCLYREKLGDVDEISLFAFDIAGGEVPLWTDALVKKRAALVDYLEKHGIVCRNYWLPLHRQKPYRFDSGFFPNSSRLPGRCVWLPSSFGMTDKQLRTVCARIKSFYSGKT